MVARGYNMKIAVFSTRRYDKTMLNRANLGCNHELQSWKIALPWVALRSLKVAIPFASFLTTQ